MLSQFTFAPPSKDPDVIPWGRLGHSSWQPSYGKDVSYFKDFKDAILASFVAWHFSDLWGHCIFLNSQLVCGAFFSGWVGLACFITHWNVEGRLQILSSVPVLLFGECLLTLSEVIADPWTLSVHPWGLHMQRDYWSFATTASFLYFCSVIGRWLPKPIFQKFWNFFLLAKGYVVKLQLLIQIQT